MDAATFFGLEPDPDVENRWRLPVVDGLSTGGSFLFGGCVLGAAVEAMEQAAGRPVVWATAQFLDYARPPQVADIDVTLAVHGRKTSQARALLSVDGTEIITVNAALGERPGVVGDGQWATRPTVPPPEDCPPRTMRDHHVGSIMSRIDTRLANARDMADLDGTPGDGRAALWARFGDMLEPSAASLAILGDYVPFGIGQTLGGWIGGNSLDNTLRVGRLVPTDWVLIDVHMHAIGNGFAHGRVHLWATDGTLLGTASQSVIVRRWGQDPPGPQEEK